MYMINGEQISSLHMLLENDKTAGAIGAWNSLRSLDDSPPADFWASNVVGAASHLRWKGWAEATYCTQWRSGTTLWVIDIDGTPEYIVVYRVVDCHAYGGIVWSMEIGRRVS